MRTRLTDLLIALIALAAGGTAVVAPLTVDDPDAVTPECARGGWVAPAPEDIAGAMPFVLQTSSGADTDRTVAKLWNLSQAINGGKHFPTFLQEVGDCVSQGSANAVNYLQAAQLARGPPVVGAFEFRPAHRSWIYGVSRTAKDIGNGRLGGSDGSIGAWAAKTVERYGVLAQEDGPDYSGTIAREWGSRGVPDQYFWQAALFKVRTTALVTTWDQLADSLLNFYPVTCAGNVGFKMQTVVRDGKHWGVPSGSWSHQMCWIGIDTEAVSPFDGRAGAVYTLNSWGANAHGPPADDAPPGGFWIDRTTAERYLRQNDCWAYSNFDGFPARDLDFQVFRDGASAAPAIDVQFTATDALPVPVSEHFAHVAPPTAQTGGCAGCTLALLLLARRIRKRAAATRRAAISQRHTAA